MKKLISILLIVTMLTLCLCSCELKDKITDTVSGWFGNKEEETTTAPEEETTTKPQEEETTTKPQEEETTTKPAPWAPGASDADDKKPIELPGLGVTPTVGQ